MFKKVNSVKLIAIGGKWMRAILMKVIYLILFTCIHGQYFPFTHDNNQEHKYKLHEILLKSEAFYTTGKYIEAYSEYTKAVTAAS